MIGGPTPLEIARNPYGWWNKSEEFYISGKTLLNIRNENLIKLNEECVGKQISIKCEKIRELINVKTPIVFNLSFSIELLVKAILIRKDPIRWIPDKGKVKFGHKIHKLINENIDIKLNENEIIIAKRIEDYISYGKYPERVNPGNIIEDVEDLFNYNPYVNWSLLEFFEIISSLRQKLGEYLKNLIMIFK